MYHSLSSASNSSGNSTQTRRGRRDVALGIIVSTLLIAGVVSSATSAFPRSVGSEEKLEKRFAKENGQIVAVVDIKGGRLANDKEFPFAVFLGCTGSLFAPNWVMTAKHCGSVVQGWKMYAGSTKQHSGVQRVVSSVVDNPHVDMKLVYVENPFPLTDRIGIVPYLFLNSKDSAVVHNNAALVVGFSTHDLKVANVVVQEEAAHKRLVSCNASPCPAPGTDGRVRPGDSGGPLVADYQGHFVQWGVTKAMAGEWISIFVDASYFYEWIQDTMKSKPVSLPFSIGLGANSAGLYVVLNKKSGKILTAPSSSGSQIYQYSKNNGENQKWELVPAEQELGYYFVKSVSTGLYWDIYGNSVNNGGKLSLYTLKSTAGERANQMFKFEAVAGQKNGYFKVTSRLSGRVLDVEGNSVANNAKVIQWDWKGSNNDNQIFQVLRA